MLVLALDTSTPLVTAGLVQVRHPHELIEALRSGADAQPVVGLAQRTADSPFAHAEQLMPLATAALADAGHRLADLAAVVVGLGPGPFTGLRVGVATAAALGDALDLPVHGVPSHDGAAATVAPADAGFLVVTDARRREVYVSAYSPDGRRGYGPAVLTPGALAALISTDPAAPPVLTQARALLGAGADLVAALGLARLTTVRSTAVGLVTRALPALVTGAVPGPLTPLYLRRPDAVPPAPRTVAAR